MVLAAPHHEAAAKAHDPLLDVDHPGLPPRFVEPITGPSAVELLDVRPEEPSRVPPRLSAERVSGRGHQGARIEPPARPPHRVWRHVKVEARHASARAEDSHELDQRGRRIRDVAQQVRERHRVKGSVREREFLGAAMLEPDPLVQAGVVDKLATAVEHRLADVDPDDVGLRRASQRDGDPGRPGRDVQDAPRLKTREMADEHATPAAVLAQRQDPGETVIARRQILEETRREGVLRARGRRAGISHGRLQGTGSRAGLGVDGWMRSSALAAAFAFAMLAPAPAQAAQPPLLTSCTARSDTTDAFSYRFCSAPVASFDGIQLDTDLTMPAGRTPSGGYPLLVMMHGWGGSKDYWEAGDFCTSTSADACNYNNVWFAHRGYAVVTYTARGFHASQGYTHLADIRYEVHDTQHLGGLLVDAGVALPGIGVTGLSYGGGQAWLLAVLAFQVMKPDGTLESWRSPRGTALHIAAAVPKYTWSDLVDALQPNGRSSDGVLTPNGNRANPIGIEKKSYVDYFYLSGQQTGRYAPPGQDLTADITTWYAEIRAGEPA